MELGLIRKIDIDQEMQLTDTLIGDLDGLYHPGLFNDRLLLGLKGTMAEAELHVLRMRLNGAIRNKAKRGELRRGLPVGLLWGEGEGEVIFHPDQAVTNALRVIFEKFAELGSARQVWLWFKAQGLLFPHQCPNGQMLWVKPTYIAIHSVLSNPVYAGAYAYGKSRCERYVDETGRVRQRARLLPMDQWVCYSASLALIPALLLFFIYVFAGDLLLRQVFGAYYAAAHTTLVLLGLGQLTNIWAGACGNVLAMTGHERILMDILLLTILVTIPLAMVLGRYFGLNGIAMAFASGLTIQNLLLWWATRRLVGIWTHATARAHPVALLRVLTSRGRT